MTANPFEFAFVVQIAASAFAAFVILVCLVVSLLKRWGFNK